MDGFTKFVEAIPMANQEAATVARALVEHVVVRYGTPIQILTDQGTNFDGNLFRELCRMLDVDKVRTSSYHPSGNGLIERFHRTLNAMLGKVISDHQRDWDEFLPFVMAAYRASPHEATGYTPNFLMFGRETRAPLDLLYGKPSDGGGRAGNYGDFAQKLEETLESAYRLVREQLRTAAERQKHSYDLRIRPVAFNDGARVLYYTPRRYRGKSPKWQRMYTGPFVVVKRCGLVNYLIQKKPGSRPFVVHVDKLRRFYDGDQPEPGSALSLAPSEVILRPSHALSGVRHQSAERPQKTDDGTEPGEGSILSPPASTGDVNDGRPKRAIRRPARFLQ